MKLLFENYKNLESENCFAVVIKILTDVKKKELVSIFQIVQPN